MKLEISIERVDRGYWFEITSFNCYMKIHNMSMINGIKRVYHSLASLYHYEIEFQSSYYIVTKVNEFPSISLENYEGHNSQVEALQDAIRKLAKIIRKAHEKDKDIPIPASLLKRYEIEKH